MTGSPNLRRVGPEDASVVRRVVQTWAAMPGRVVIFDFNGTLSDDEPLLLMLYTDIFAQQLGWTLSADEYFVRFAGRSDRAIVEMAVAEAAPGDNSRVVAMLEARRRGYRRLVGDRSPIPPATAELVSFLHGLGIPLAVVTGAERPDVDLVLRASRLDTAFQAIVSDEDVTHGKPDPEGFLLAASQLETAPSAALVFEDSTYGISAARAAGMRCIAVAGTSRRGDLGEAEAVVSSLDAAVFADVFSGPPTAERGEIGTVTTAGRPGGGQSPS